MTILGHAEPLQCQVHDTESKERLVATLMLTEMWTRNIVHLVCEHGEFLHTLVFTGLHKRQGGGSQIIFDAS